MNNLIPIEIKSSKTINDSFFKGLLNWQEITKQTVTSYIVYNGSEEIARKQGKVFPWNAIAHLLQLIYTGNSSEM